MPRKKSWKFPSLFAACISLVGCTSSPIEIQRCAGPAPAGSVYVDFVAKNVSQRTIKQFSIFMLAVDSFGSGYGGTTIYDYNKKMRPGGVMMGRAKTFVRSIKGYRMECFIGTAVYEDGSVWRDNKHNAWFP